MGAFAVIHKKNQEIQEEEIRRRLKETAADIRDDLETCFYSDEHVAMMSLETGPPMTSRLKKKTTGDGNLLVAVADLRLDNQQELQQMLNDSSVSCPVELLLELYEDRGEKFIRELLGDFAFVIYDRQKNKLIAGRDPIGVRPHFYSETDKAFVCSSDLDFLLAMPFISDEIDKIMFAGWFTGNVVHHPEHMLYKQIKRLRPAHYIDYSDNTKHLKRYFSWDEVTPIRFAHDEDYLEELRRLVTQAIKDRIVPGQKTGAHLSGGLDSTSIAVILNREGQKPEAFSWAPTPSNKDRENSEYPQIRTVCKNENLNCHFTDSAVEDAMKSLQENPARYPVSFIPEELVRNKAKELGVKQIFSGWGGDEGVAFNGRAYFMELFRNGKFITLMHETIMRAREFNENPLKVFYGRVLRFIPPFSWRQKELYKTQRKRKKALDELEDYGIDVNLIKKLGRQAEKWQPPYTENKNVHLTQKQLYEKGHLAARCEAWAMRGLRDNINYEFPLLDQRILSYALAIPSKYFFYQGWKRWLYREGMRTFLPDSICWLKSKTEPEFIKHMEEIKGIAEKNMLKRIQDNPANKPKKELSAIFPEEQILCSQLIKNKAKNNLFHNKIIQTFQLAKSD